MMRKTYERGNGGGGKKETSRKRATQKKVTHRSPPSPLSHTADANDCRPTGFVQCALELKHRPGNAVFTHPPPKFADNPNNHFAFMARPPNPVTLVVRVSVEIGLGVCSSTRGRTEKTRKFTPGFPWPRRTSEGQSRQRDHEQIVHISNSRRAGHHQP